MLFLKIVDAVFLIGFILALRWGWKHQRDIQQKALQAGAMPRDASRGLVYGLIIFLVAGVLMVSVYWLF